MKPTYLKTASAALLLALLTACGGDSDNTSSNNNGDNGGGDTAQRLQDIAANDASDAPGAINAPADLQQDITALFGDANSDPVAVETGDTLQDVMNRANN